MLLLSLKQNMNFLAFLFLLNILLIISPCLALKSNVSCIESEREALMNFKKDIIDSSNRLSSWNASSEFDCCKWAGVFCNNITGHITELRLGNPFSDYETKAEYQAYERAQLGGKINPSLQHLKHLRVLDLSYNNFNGASIPAFIGSLKSLQQLNLSRAGFGGIIPSQIRNLSSLQSLGLSVSYSYYDLRLKNNNLQWLSGLPLRRLQLDRVNLSGVSNLPHIMNSFSSLHELSLSYCGLSTSFSSLLLTPNFSSSLIILDVSGNLFGPSIPCWIFGLHNLVSLNLGYNVFKGIIPIGLQNLTLLGYLNLEANEFNSTLPEWFHNFTHLEFLSISRNHLTGVQQRSLWGLCRLKVLYLVENLIVGNMSDIFGSWVGECASPSLQELDLGYNSISGPLPESFWHLSLLKVLDIGYNKLDGIVTEVQLNNLSNLKELRASENSLILNVSDNWVPSFGLQTLGLGGWKLGPQFPVWLQTQKDLIVLDLFNTGISDSLPTWLWNMTASIRYLDLARNQIYGKLPNIQSSNIFSLDLSNNAFSRDIAHLLHSSNVKNLYLSNNFFSGVIARTLLSPNLRVLDLSNNFFSGDIAHVLPSTNLLALDLSNNYFSGDIADFLCVRTKKHALQFLNLQNNNLSGEIPDCWTAWPKLAALWLGNNYFSGQIPSSMGYPEYLLSLHLQNNRLSGPLPQSLQNCSSLITLDLSVNSFTGKLPTWIGKFQALMQFLNLRSNRLEGEIPIELCYLTSLQILDIAQNNFAGRIPRCFKNFTAMTRRQTDILSWAYSGPRQEYMQVVEKGKDNVYDKFLSLMSTMDLSSNNLSGEIPNELMDLVALQSLNLSQNHFTGTIPKKIGDMRFLESLDLSSNHLSGKIPLGISNLDFLSYLNLSHNNLTGPIPSGTQLRGLDPSCFNGNNLCGPPLARICGADIPLPYVPVPDDEDLNENDSIWFYSGVPWGFGVGFWCVIGLLFVKKSWRLVYFRFLDHIWEKFSIIILKCKKFLP